MSSSDLAISVRGLSKSYTIAHNREKHSTLVEAAYARIRHPFKRQSTETFWALNDVSFDIKQGDVVGIIGRNGAGKSTLLKILSRITGPTKGEIDVYGRIGSLLEVGTGFHPELTGRENVFLNGAILGMRRWEIQKQFDAIVDFAGVEQFIDTPVKRYSSGMYVRLAFAVAAHLNPEILIVDEVLAVGDSDFQKKCLGKMKDVAELGRTVIFVSHNMAAVQSLCTSSVLLRSGKVVTSGSVDSVFNEYLRSTLGITESSLAARTDRSGTGDARAIDIQLFDQNHEPILAGILPNQPFQIELTLNAKSPVRNLLVSVDIETVNGGRVASLYSGFKAVGFDVDTGVTTLRCEVPGLPLRPDSYWLHIMLGNATIQFDFVFGAMRLDVLECDFYESGQLPQRVHGPLLPNYEWSHCNSPAESVI